MSGDPTVGPPPPQRHLTIDPDKVVWWKDDVNDCWLGFFTIKEEPKVTKKLVKDLRWCAETDGNGGLVIYQKEAKAILAELGKKYE